MLGALQPTPTIATGYAVYPFVGLIESGQAWTLSPREVAEVLELRLAALRDGHAEPTASVAAQQGDAIVYLLTNPLLALTGLAFVCASLVRVMTDGVVCNT